MRDSRKDCQIGSWIDVRVLSLGARLLVHIFNVLKHRWRVLVSGFGWTRSKSWSHNQFLSENTKAFSFGKIVQFFLLHSCQPAIKNEYCLLFRAKYLTVAGGQK